VASKITNHYGETIEVEFFSGDAIELTRESTGDGGECVTDRIDLSFKNIKEILAWIPRREEDEG
jgi:hypothetical protein